LVIIVDDQPGACEERKGDHQEQVAIFCELFPGGGLKIIKGGQGYACQQTVEAGPGGVIDELIIGSSARAAAGGYVP
jgi:hypothetical protein